MILNSPWGLTALLAVPVIIILYLLKQKHEDYIISSIFLWQNALQDIEANAPWQKLKKNILMFLQIVAVVLLALLLAEPAVKTGSINSDAVMLVMDCSLSMQSTDIKPNRFEAARRDAINLVESCSSNTKFILIVSGNTPQIVLSQTNDKDRVIQEIQNLKVSDTAQDLEGTIELVNSLLRENSEMQVNWFGDGVNPVSDSSSGNVSKQSSENVSNHSSGNISNQYISSDNIQYHLYNRNGANYAVTLLSQRKLQNSQEIMALSRIANFSLEDAELDVSLYTDGELFDARRVRVEAGKSENIYWKKIPASASRLECRIDTDDTLDKDNSAGLMVHTNKVRKVLLSSAGNIFLEKLLSLMPDVELYRTDAGDIQELKGYELYIFDGNLPEQLPGDGHIILFNPPQNEYFSLAGKSEYTEIRCTKHRIYNNLEENISFDALKTDLYHLPQWSNPLMENDEGIVAFEGYLDKFRLMVFGFDLHETNLPVQPLFPVIMTRFVQELLPGGLNEISAVNAGDLINLSIDPEAREVFVIAPDGNKTQIAPPFPVDVFDGATQIGTYILEQKLENENLQQAFFVNAPSEKEFAMLEGTKSLQQDVEKVQEHKQFGFWNIKIPLLCLLFAILAIEWWVYSNGI
ncbi:MAG TPA: VWA domain-containing protein [Clostridiaceae bacterium]|nr:VWA domain-containing protein [Clostridiaceae bacterium]HHV99086.1 VWA domain-containing protein [Clostridiaceae bacterium]